eukprot:6196513-Pleurochrysis_carterae.AAC.1
MLNFANPCKRAAANYLSTCACAHKVPLRHHSTCAHASLVSESQPELPHRRLPWLLQELERYHKNNSALELTISNLRLKNDGMQREILGQRTKLSDADSKVQGLCTELHDCVQHIQASATAKAARYLCIKEGQPIPSLLMNNRTAVRTTVGAL